MKILILLVIGTLSALWRGVVLSIIWLWFVIPHYNYNLPLGLSVGIIILISLLKKIETKKTEPEEFGETVENAITYEFIYPGVVFFVGWIISFIV